MTAAAGVRHCIKCGAEVGPDESMCAACNRAGMATPSATQYHGTIVVAIIAGVAALAIAASLSLRGIGPYQAQVAEWRPADAGGYEVTFAVTNDGTRAGRAKCQLVALGEANERLASRSMVTDAIAAGASVTVTERWPGLRVEPAEVRASCS